MTNTMKLKSALVATLFAGVSSVAMAQAIEFATVDTDGDGMLSMDEVKTLLPDLTDDQLVVSDANGDGMLDEAEYQVLTGG